MDVKEGLLAPVDEDDRSHCTDTCTLSQAVTSLISLSDAEDVFTADELN